MRILLPILVGLLSLTAVFAQAQDDPAEVAIGERLFLETRFAQFFAEHSQGDVNLPLAAGDPVVATSETTGAPLGGPFAGQSINCRSCHLVDEQQVFDAQGFPSFDEGGMRTYADFARRSPIPRRDGDGATRTPRNSPALVNASVARKAGLSFHFDGEFPSLASLVRATLTGRNYGWLPSEHNQAIAQIVRVVRKDDGSGELAHEFGGPYARVLLGTDPRIPEELRLPRNLRIDVVKASNEKIVRAVAKLIAIYVEQLEFATDASGAFTGSPFDLFLARNQLPRQPKKGETAFSYSRRLAAALNALPSPRFVTDVDGPFALHPQPFEFGPDELAGLRVFLREPSPSDAPDATGVGNCVACHPAPFFTDFLFHNTGVSQLEYDGVHGDGAFAALEVPGEAERKRDPEAFLPATPKHPNGTGRFRAAVAASRPELADLGLWNVFGNKDFSDAQGRVKSLLKRSLTSKVGKKQMLDASLARFKTPGLRDLGHSGPYMHNGAFDTLASVVQLYMTTSELERSALLRNGASQLADVHLAPGDVAAVAAFLRSLDEDYD